MPTIQINRKSEITAAGPVATCASNDAISANPSLGLLAAVAFLACSVWMPDANAQQSPISTVSPRTQDAEKEVVELRPFIVTEDSDDTYEANNTSGVTGTNREIRKLPITMNVATAAFMKDINATNFLDVIEMMPNVSPTTPDTNNGGNAQQDTYRLRGMTSKEERRRNGVLSLAIADTFSTDRIEFLRGAQSLLYGQGISTGAVNVVTKRAAFGKKQNQITMQIDDLGSKRFTLDGNYGLKNLAVRVAAVNAKKLFWQDQLLDNTRGVYAELAYRLNANLVARVNHEYTEGHSTLRGGALIISDNSLKDPRNNLTLDRVLYENRDVSDIFLGGKNASWTNYRSVSSVTSGRDSRSNVTNLSLEGTFGRNLSALLSYSYEHDLIFNKANGSNQLLSPNDSRAVNRQWSYTVDPNGAALIRWYLETLRGNMIYHHTIGNFLKADLVLGFESRFKYQTIHRKRLYAVDASGAPVAGGDRFGRVQLAPYVIPVSNALSTRIGEVPGYKYMDTHAYNVVTPTALNPRGLGGVGTPIDRPERQKAVNLSWLGAWFDGRLETMAGLRRDHILLRDNVSNNTDNDSAKTSGLVGGVFNVTRNIGVYVNAARSFSAVPATRLQVYNNTSSEWPIASGKSMEAGLKFDVLKDRISGALAFYDNKNHGELVGAGAGVDLFNPAGINGRYTGIGSATGMYVEARGAELTVTLRPAKGWRMILTAGTNDAKTTEPSRAAILYNDQFNTIGTTVAVKSANGDLNPLLVPSVRTVPNSTRIPLTIEMMRDSSSPYFAQLDPNSGRIINANSLFLTTNGVATGVSGLPVSQHQLGFQAPGSGIATVIQPGDSLAPVVGKSAMFNTSYTFSSGPLNRVSVGGLLTWRGDYRLGYAVINGTRQLYYAPEQVRADLRFGYNWILKSSRSISFQLSVSNLMDKQTLLPSLNVSNGTVTSVSIVEAPRSYVLTASLRF